MKTLIEIKQTCYACPSAWEGTTKDGDNVYIRYRYGCLSLYVNDDLITQIEFGDPMDGFIKLYEALTKLEDYICISPNAVGKYEAM